MRFADLLAFAWQVLGGYRTRTALILLAMGSTNSIGASGNRFCWYSKQKAHATRHALFC